MFAQVVINEISVVPEDKYDWVELYSVDTIDISDWKVADEAGVFETIPPGTILGEGIYYVVTQYQRLDNNHDIVYLQDAAGLQRDFIKYGYDGEICVPSATGSIARVPDANSHYYKVVTHSKNATNNLSILDSCPTPTPQPTSTNTPTSTHTPTPSPSPSPTPKPSNTPTPTKFPTPKPTVSEETLVVQNKKIEKQREVLGFQETKSDGDEEASQKKTVPFIAIVAIIIGIVFMGIALFPFMRSLIESWIKNRSSL